MSKPSTTSTDTEKLKISLQALAARLGKTPTVVDMHNKGDYHPEAYVDEYGRWDAALEAANLDPDDMGAKKYSDYTLLTELHRLNDDLGHSPTQEDMREHGEFSAKTYRDRFGSWNNALDEAMLEHTQSKSDDALLRELQRLASELGDVPRVKDMEEHGEYAPVTYHRRFGSWLEALEEAGLTR